MVEFDVWQVLVLVLGSSGIVGSLTWFFTYKQIQDARKERARQQIHELILKEDFLQLLGILSDIRGVCARIESKKKDDAAVASEVKTIVELDINAGKQLESVFARGTSFFLPSPIRKQILAIADSLGKFRSGAAPQSTKITSAKELLIEIDKLSDTLREIMGLSVFEK